MTAILNDITQQYQAATLGWYNYLFPVANHLFAVLAVIEIAWSGVSWALEKQDMGSLWVEFLKRILFIGFFYAILLHANAWIPAIIKSFMMLGSGASHINKLDPSSIFEQGISIANSVFVPLLKASLFTTGFAYITALLTAFLVVVSFAVIAGELVVTLVESYLVIGAGIIFLGLGSSRWTNSFTTKFLNYAISVGCKLFFLYLIIGVGANMAQNWGQMIVEGGLTNMVPFLEVMGGSLVFVFISWTIPHKAASLMSGAVGSSVAGLFVASNMMQGAANTVTRPVSGSVNSVKNIINQGSKTRDMHRENKS